VLAITVPAARDLAGSGACSDFDAGSQKSSIREGPV
jgi:hypothetical protein